LNRHSQALWPGFADEVEAAAGLAVGYRGEGTLLVALDRDDRARLQATYEFQRRLGLDLAWLGAAETGAREPHLSPGLAGAIFSPGDHQVDNRLLTVALAAAFRRAGGLDAIRLFVRPVKGQMLALRMDPAAPLLRHVVSTKQVYLVPRGDGRLIV